MNLLGNTFELGRKKVSFFFFFFLSSTQNAKEKKKKKLTDLYSCGFWVNWWRRWPEELWRFDNCCRPACLFRFDCWSADRDRLHCHHCFHWIPRKPTVPLPLWLLHCWTLVTVGRRSFAGKASSWRFENCPFVVFVFSLSLVSIQGFITSSNSTEL